MTRAQATRAAAGAALALLAGTAAAQWTYIPPDIVRNTNSGSIAIGVLPSNIVPGKLTVMGAGDAGVAIWARGMAANGSALYGETCVPGAASVVGHNLWSQGGRAVGVLGMSDAPNGMGLVGMVRSPSGSNIGVYGASASPQGFAGYFDSRVFMQGPVGVGMQPVPEARMGVLGSGVGVMAQTSSSNANGAAILAIAHNAPANAGVFVGDVDVSGLLAVEGGVMTSAAVCVRMDHPFDPEHRDLIHYMPDSPEALNFYRGTVVLNGSGNATVALPPYFPAINRDPTYTLTPVGGAMPYLHVSRPIVSGGSTFEISGGVPGYSVCWRVEAVRCDPEMMRRGTPVEIRKDPARTPGPYLGVTPPVTTRTRTTVEDPVRR